MSAGLPYQLYNDPSATQSETPASETEKCDSLATVVQVEADDRTIPKADDGANELTFEDQSIRLPFGRLLLIYFGIGLALFLSFVDQTSVSTAAPVIGAELGGSDSISWLGTSFLVANCAMHLVYGRLSDIFGRKTMLQVALAFLGFGNLLCGFAKTPVQLYAFRAIAGLGGGGVNGIAMTVVSDIVSLKDRGKYQGFISAACSLGSAIGPFIGGGLSTVGQWRWLFWMTSPLSLLIIIGTHLILPLKEVTGSTKQKLAQIDYTGIVLSAAAAIMLLVPISGGGTTFAWNSATVIALLVIGSCLMVGFIVAEWKFAALPILPLRLFKTPTVSIITIQSFLIGIMYYGNIFYIPMWLQYVMGYSALKSGYLLLIYQLPSVVWGILSGQLISSTGRYKLVIIFGCATWTLSSGLQLLWTSTTKLPEILGILAVNQLAIGFCLQTTMVAMMAVTPDKDRAVVTSSRNFFRTMGGAFGLAVCNAIYNNHVSAHLPDSLTISQRKELLQSATGLLQSLPVDVKRDVLSAYAAGLRSCFLLFTVAAGMCFVLSLFIKEVQFRSDSPELVKEKASHDVEKAIEIVLQGENTSESELRRSREL